MSGVGSGAFANAGRGVAQAGITNTLSGGYNAQQGQLYHTLFPTLRQNLTNPQGFGSSMPAINTANQESIGGSLAGAFGQGNLQTARTRNAGGFAPALDEAVRSGQRTLSQNAVGVQEESAALKNEQQQAAEKALGEMYGNNLDATLKALGLSNQSLGISNDALNTANRSKTASPWSSVMPNLVSSWFSPKTADTAATMFGG